MWKRFHFRKSAYGIVTASVCIVIVSGAFNKTEMKAEAMQDVRFVVFHNAGPNWQKGVDFGEQPGVVEHVKHYRSFFEQGKLEMGGPYLVPDSGGMMIPAAGLSEEEIRRFAEDDPAVKSGLLEFEVRPWYVAMRK